MREYSIKEIIPESKHLQGYFAGSFEDTEDPEIEWPHRHAFYSIVWFTKGSGINVIDFFEYEILPNRLFTINPKQVHNWDYSKISEGYILVFEAHLANESGIEFASPFIDIPDTDQLFFRLLFKKLITESRQNDRLGQRNGKLGISYLCSLIDRFSSDRETPGFALANFRDLICKDFSETKTVEAYAEILHISPAELNTVCRKSVGTTAKQYQLDLKITEAKRLLLYTKLNISEVAYQTGFEDTSYFSRIFKKKTGLSPVEFNEKYLKN
jgi:AraC family transcriptional regulator, transcriptional activator of pobA